MKSYVWTLVLHVQTAFLYKLAFAKNNYSTYSTLYLHTLAKLSYDVQLEPNSDASENIKQTLNQKVLKRPIAFSYNSNKQQIPFEKVKNITEAIDQNKHLEQENMVGKKNDTKNQKYNNSTIIQFNLENNEINNKARAGKSEAELNENMYKVHLYKDGEEENVLKYHEIGHYAHGHNIRGTHNIQNKDYYENNHEFFDEYSENYENDKDDAFSTDDDYSKGSSIKNSLTNLDNFKNKFVGTDHNEIVDDEENTAISENYKANETDESMKNYSKSSISVHPKSYQLIVNINNISNVSYVPNKLHTYEVYENIDESIQE